MAAPATPSGILPKSNFYRSNASAPIGTSDPSVPAPAAVARPEHAETVSDDAEAFAYPPHVIPPLTYEGVENLVIVCCHAIFHPDASSSNFPLLSPYDERNWHLAPFQVSNPDTGKPGEHETFLAHALTGVDALSRGSLAENSLLILSGGATKASLTTLSEARSYYHATLSYELAQGNQGGGHTRRLFSKGRILLEEHATDSFQNLLFSILLFRRATGIYPKQVRVITHAFKAKRFLDLHAPAIRWPPDHIQVQGIDPAMSKAELDETLINELLHGYRHWEQDPLGTGQILTKKRKQRGWDDNAVKEIGEGLEECIQEFLHGNMPEDLPWMLPKTTVSASLTPS